MSACLGNVTSLLHSTIIGRTAQYADGTYKHKHTALACAAASMFDSLLLLYIMLYDLERVLTIPRLASQRIAVHFLWSSAQRFPCPPRQHLPRLEAHAEAAPAHFCEASLLRV